MERTRARARVLTLAASLTLLAGGLVAGAPPAQAATKDIASGGPLTHIWVGDTLSCQVQHAGDGVYSWYHPGQQEPTCGTRLYLAGSGAVFGPLNTYGRDWPWSQDSQTAVTGSGTSADPYAVVTVVDAILDPSGASTDTGVQLTQTDTYVVGEESYRTDVRIDNTSGSAVDGILYRSGDCYLQDSDFGYGIHDPVNGSVGCRASTDEDSRVEEWVPITTGSHYYESYYNSVVSWPTNFRGQNFPDTSDDLTHQDNGTGISWSLHVGAGGHKTFSSLSAFSPTGAVPLSTSKTADDDTVAPDEQTGYTITVHNPNTSDVTLDDVTDDLPSGFAYVSGSTTDATTTDPIADPSIDSGDLTWSGPFTAPAGGDFSLHFGVVAPSAPGNYSNQAGATAADDYSVAPTGPTAQITVEELQLDADLSLTKSDAAPNGPDPVTAGNNVSYLIEVSNGGPDDSTGVAVTDDLPGEASLVSAGGDGWTCDYDSESHTVFCTRDGLSVDQTASINVVVKAPTTPPVGCGDGPGSCITDSATVDFFGPDDQFDDNDDNNTAEESTEVEPKPANSDDSTGFVPAGGGTVTTGNNPNAADTTDASVRLPAGPGGVVDIHEEDPPEGLCVGGCRGQAVVIEIPEGYTNSNQPPKLVLKYDVTVVRPKGGAKIYVQKPPDPPVLVPLCDEHTVADPHPCVGSRQRLANGDLKVTVLLLSGDPIFGRH
jgi:uncharacterized repeat protein (TIGR01451 family)